MVERKGIELENRRETYNFISKHPGLHLSELSRKLNISKSTISYHLNHLQKLGLIVTKSEGKYIRFYVANKVGEIDKKLLSLLRQDVPYRIVIFLLINPDSSQIRISRYLKRHPTTVSFHLSKLADLDIIETFPNCNEIIYNIKNPQYIYDLLTKYEDSFFDGGVNNILTFNSEQDF